MTTLVVVKFLQYIKAIVLLASLELLGDLPLTNSTKLTLADWFCIKFGIAFGSQDAHISRRSNLNKCETVVHR